MSKKTETTAEAAKPPPPPHLSKEMEVFWTTVFQTRNLQPHEVLLLAKALEAHDRAEQARRDLKRQGLTFQDRFGQPRARPEVAIERDSRAGFAKLLSQINLHTLTPWRP